MQNREAGKEFEKRIREHEALLHKICRMYASSNADRQDLFQEIVIQLWRTYQQFRGEARWSTWLYRVAINTAITGLRGRKDFISSYEPENLPQRIDDNDGSEGEEERLQQFYKAVGQLNGVEKAIVMLYMEDRSYDEMEDILGISSGTLRVKMNRIKEKLRQLTKND